MSLGRRVRAWIAEDGVYARIVRNVSWLLSSHAAGALLGIVTLTVTARAIGPAGLGLLAVVQSYVRVTDRLLRLEPWQVLIRYGLEALAAGDEARFLRLVKLSILIDLAGGVLAGGVAVLLAPAAVRFFDLGEGGEGYVLLVALGLFIALRPTGLGVLRTLDRFDLLAKADVAAAAIRLVLSVAAWALGLEIWAFMGILLVEMLLNNLVAFWLAMRELRRRGLVGLPRASAVRSLRENEGLLRFLWNSNFNVILRQSTQRFDVIMLAPLVSAEAVGLYYLGKRVAEAVLKVARPLSQAIYPEFARSWSEGAVGAFRKLVFVTSGGLLVVSVLVFVAAANWMSPILGTFFGAEFAPAALLTTVQLLAVLVYLTGILLNPAMLSMGRDRELVRITLVATGLFYVLFVPLVYVLGPMGAALDHLILNTVWLAGCVVTIWKGTQAAGRTQGAVA